MDSSDEFDDIFLDSTSNNAGRDPNKEGTIRANATAEKFKDTDTTDSSSSDDSDGDSSSDDSSVESIEPKNGGLFNSSRTADRSGSQYFSNSDESCDDAVGKGDVEPTAESTDVDLSDPDLDDEALADFFSGQTSPKSQTLTEENQQSKKREIVIDLDDESSDEEVIVERKKKFVQSMSIFDVDDDDLAELEEDKAEDEEKPARDTSNASPAGSVKKKPHSPGHESDDLDMTPRELNEDDFISKKIEDKTPFRITYNGEKKKCEVVDDMLFDSSDDDGSKASADRLNQPQFNFSSRASKGDSYKAPADQLSSRSKSSNDNKENDASVIPPRTNPYQKSKKPTKDVSNSSRCSAAYSAQVENDSAAPRTELQRLNISHDNFKPTAYSPRPDPILHTLNESNRPIHRRQKIAVDQIFSRPFSNMFTCKFKEFNHLQTEMSNFIANSDDNLIVSSPTGSGKTALFEMAMCRLFASTSARGNRVVSNSKKVVYIAPNKALCEERQVDWSKRLMEIDPTIVCTTVTGDANTAASSYGEIASANLILTTPEKWDSITRHWTEYVVLLGSIKLMLLDEVHMIGEPGRGASLEAVISRMKTIHRAATSRTFSHSEIQASSFNGADPDALASNLRFVAVSATLPNLDQLANFIEAGEAYAFNDSYRPVPLHTHVQACGHRGSNFYLFDKGLNQHVTSILHRFSKGRPSIVFCHSKNETEQLADELTKSYSNSSSLNTSALNTFANRANASSLKRYLRCGVAYHHAGLEFSDRKVVEDAFMSGSINCLCATSTLAQGVNLPSHLVIVKGTTAYRGKDGYVDIDTGTLLQMIGRAGRPGFDTSGTAVIMTDSASKSRFENLSQGLKVVESQLLQDDKLTEVLNSEIAQGVISSKEEAMHWAMGTLLFQRIQIHPLFYGLNTNRLDDVSSYIARKCDDSIEQLRKIGAIIMMENETFSPSAASMIMSHNFLDLPTLKSITKLSHDAGPHQILHLLSNCANIQSPVKRKDKKHLKEAHKQIRYKLEGPQSKLKIQTPAEKVFILLQSAIINHHFEEFSLRQDMNNAVEGAVRVLTSIEEYSRKGSRNGHVLVQCHLLRRSFYHGMWGDNDGVLKQIGGVTQDLEAKLKSSGIVSFSNVVNNDAQDIAEACGMPVDFGDKLRAAAAMILQCALKLHSHTNKTEDGLDLIIQVQHKEVDGFAAQSGNAKDNVKYSLLVFTDRPGGLLLSCDDVSEERQVTVRCPEQFGRAYIRLISNLVGLDEQTSVDGNGRIEKSSFSLSPTVAKSSTKSKKGQRAPPKPPETAKKRLFESHRSSVSNISDLRLHKRGKIERGSKKVECIELNSDGEGEITTHHAELNSSLLSNKTKKAVTPSPHPDAKSCGQNEGHSTPTFGSKSSSRQSSSTHTQTASSNPYAAKKLSNNSRTIQNRTKWNQDKRGHRVAQQRAFHSPKDNPFSSYSYDPNSIERSLNSSATGSRNQVQPSIIPTTTARNFSSTSKATYSKFPTPATRRKGSAASNRMSGSNLLQQKAMEMNHYHKSSVSSRFNNTCAQMQRSVQNDYHTGDFDVDPQSDISFYNPHQNSMPSNMYIMDKSFATASRPRFTQNFDSDAHFHQSHPFTQGNHDAHFTQPSFDRPFSSAGHSFGAHQSAINPYTRNNGGPFTQLSFDNRPISSAGHSNGSGIRRFQQNYMPYQHHFVQNDRRHYEAFPQEQEFSHPDSHMQVYHGNGLASQTDQRFDAYDASFSGLDPADRGHAGHFEAPAFNTQLLGGYGVAQRQTMAVRNPYAKTNNHQQSVSMFNAPEEPPKEILLQNTAMVNVHNNAADDASLAFDDAFL